MNLHSYMRWLVLIPGMFLYRLHMYIYSSTLYYIGCCNQSWLNERSSLHTTAFLYHQKYYTSRMYACECGKNYELYKQAYLFDLKHWVLEMNIIIYFVREGRFKANHYRYTVQNDIDVWIHSAPSNHDPYLITTDTTSSHLSSSNEYGNLSTSSNLSNSTTITNLTVCVQPGYHETFSTYATARCDSCMEKASQSHKFHWQVLRKTLE